MSEGDAGKKGSGEGEDKGDRSVEIAAKAEDASKAFNDLAMKSIESVHKGKEDKSDDKSNKVEDADKKMKSKDDKTVDKTITIPDDLTSTDKTEDIDETEVAEAPPGLNVKQSDAFKKMRVKLDAFDAEKASLLKQIEDTKKQYAGYEEKVQRQNLLEHPKFKADFVVPIESVKVQIATIAKDWSLDEDTISKAFRLQPKERAELITKAAGGNPVAATQLVPLFDKFGELYQKGKVAFDEYKKTFEEIDKKHKEEIVVKTQTLVDKSVEKLFKEGHFLLRESKSDPNWLKTIKSNAIVFMSGGLSEDAVAELSLKAQISDAYRNMRNHEVQTLQKEIEKLKKQLGSRVNASLPLGGKSKDVGKSEEEDKPKSINDLVEKTLQSVKK